MTRVTFQNGLVVMRDGQVGTESDCRCECAMPSQITLTLAGSPRLYCYYADLPAGFTFIFEPGDPLLDCDPAPEYFCRVYGGQGAFWGNFPGWGFMVQPDAYVTLDLVDDGCEHWRYEGSMPAGPTIAGDYDSLDCGGSLSQPVSVVIETEVVRGARRCRATVSLPGIAYGEMPLAGFEHTEALLGGEQAGDYDIFDSGAGQCVLDQLEPIDGRLSTLACPTDLVDRVYPMKVVVPATYIYKAGSPAESLPTGTCQTTTAGGEQYHNVAHIPGVTVTLAPA